MIEIQIDQINIKFPVQIWCAARFGWLDVVKLYVENFHFNVDARNSNGSTPLMVACEHNREEVVKYLLLMGSDVNARDIFDRSALHYSYLNHNPNIYYILEVLHQADTDIRDIWQRTPIHYKNILGKEQLLQI